MSRASKKPTVSPVQLKRIHAQLAEMVKHLQSNNHQQVASQITTLVRKFPAIAQVNAVAAMYFSQTGAKDQAIYYAQRSIQLDPSSADYHQTLGVLLLQKAKHKEALPVLERAFEINPAITQLPGAIAVASYQLGHIAKAKKILNTHIAQHPDDYEAVMNLALLESDIANADQAIDLMRGIIARVPNNPILHDCLSMYACYSDQLSPSDVFGIHQAFGRCIQPLVRPPRTYTITPDPSRRIRVGFISPDFKQHSNTYFVESIIEHLDRTRFEVCLYSTSSASDQVTQRFKSHADLWRDCTTGIANTAKQVSKDNIDILIELTGHFASNQLPLFAAKPAPVSLTAIGYANTTGLDCITARLVDDITDPSPTADALATEQLIRVPGCFLCYRPSNDLPEIKVDDQTRPFTFGSFNDLRKMSPSTLRTWAAILNENPDSRLTLKTSRFAQQEVSDDILNRFKALAVDPSRITLLSRTKTTKDHLALYNTIDCALDTFPYNGTTTTCEALVMGVPVLTLLGNAHAGRVSASLLTAINQQELITQDQKAYIQMATSIAQQGVRQAKDRITLHEQLMNSSLTDEKSYTVNIESLLTTLWSSWCKAQESK